MQRQRTAGFVIAVGLLVGAAGAAGDTGREVVLDPAEPGYALDPYLEWFEDTERRWTIDRLADRPELFGTEKPASGFTASRIWARFHVRPPGSDAWLLVADYSALDRICVHWPTAEAWESVCTGAALGFRDGQIQHSRLVFPVPRELGPGPVLVEAQSVFPVLLPLRIESWESFHRRGRDRLLGLALPTGALAAMVLYNLFLFFAVRDRSYLYYSLHIGCLALAFFGFQGLGQEYLWRGAPSLRAAPMFLLAATFAFGALFARSFLLTRRETPAVDRLLAAVPVVAAGGLLLAILGWKPATGAEALTGLAFAGSAIAAGVARLRQGFRPAGYFLGGQAVFLLSIPLGMAADANIVESESASSAIVPSAAALGAVLLSFGLADRLRALRRERDRLLPELISRTEELEQLAYIVSHDLRSPLVTIKGFLPLLEKDAAAGDLERVGHDVGRIATATDTMRSLLDSLGKLFRVGRASAVPERVSLAGLASEAVATLAPAIAARGVDAHIDPELPTVVGDRVHLVQILRNLLDNAVKFLGDQPAPRIEVGLRADGDERVIFVRDNGIGIAPRHHERIFGLFNQLSADSPGTGYGLALVRRLVELEGGRVWVESAGPGQGSTFCFTVQGGSPRAAH